MRDHRPTARACRYVAQARCVASALASGALGTGLPRKRVLRGESSPLVPEALATPRPAVYHPAAREVAHEPLDHPLSHAAPAGAPRTDRRRPRRERRHRARDRPTCARRRAKVILTGRDPERLRRAAIELEAQSTAAFDATDPASLERFFRDLPGRSTTCWSRRVARSMAASWRWTSPRSAATSRSTSCGDQVARHAAGKVRPGGTLLFMSGTGARRPGIGLALAATVTAALPALVANLALEIAPVRSTSSPPASWTRLCRPSSSAMSSRTAAPSSARCFPSGASSDRPTSPRSQSTSWRTAPSPARPTTSTEGSSSSRLANGPSAAGPAQGFAVAD